MCDWGGGGGVVHASLYYYYNKKKANAHTKYGKLKLKIKPKPTVKLANVIYVEACSSDV